MSELRRDPLVQRWVIISDKRGKRPSDFKRTQSTKEEENIKHGPCAFCPGFEEGTGPETFAVREGGEPNASDWRVRVIVNKFPAVSQDFACGSAVGEGTVFGECRLPAFGSHEVVIETPNHDTPLVDLPVSHICDVSQTHSLFFFFFFFFFTITTLLPIPLLFQDHDVVGEEREKLKSLLDTHWQQQRSPKKGSKLIHAQEDGAL
jgi:UDPglucose--hexose-1-phosphate uridylyltransferase